MLERIFQVAGILVLPGGLLLAAAPGWRWTQRLATFVAPLLIASVYVWLLFSHPSPKGGGFQSLAQVMVLFRSPYAVLPCLVLTFLFGPLGLGLYLLLRLGMRREVGA
jgi:predicted MFS family arabinose efflux permease